MVIRHGIPVVSNQVCFSLLDRRAAGELSRVALEEGVGLLAFGTLGGGFLSDRSVGRPEPASIPDWSRMKYKRFIDAGGGWDAVPGAPRGARGGGGAARRLGVERRLGLGAVATPPCAPPSSARGSARRSTARTTCAPSTSRSTRTTSPRIGAAAGALDPIPGDCGDEYRRPPFLTASGDLSHHLDALPPVFPSEPVPGRPDRTRATSGSVWEAKAGFSRAVRVGDRVLVSGTTATDPHGPPGLRGGRRGAGGLRARQDPARRWARSGRSPRTWCGRGSTCAAPRTGRGCRAPTPAPSAPRARPTPCWAGSTSSGPTTWRSRPRPSWPVTAVRGLTGGGRQDDASASRTKVHVAHKARRPSGPPGDALRVTEPGREGTTHHDQTTPPRRPRRRRARRRRRCRPPPSRSTTSSPTA